MRHRGLTKEQLDRAKCEDSPTGAHHWIIGKNKQGMSLGTCKYCEETRKFQAEWRDTGFVNYSRRRKDD